MGARPLAGMFLPILAEVEGGRQPHVHLCVHVSTQVRGQHVELEGKHVLPHGDDHQDTDIMVVTFTTGEKVSL